MSKAAEIVRRLAERLNNQGASVEWLERVLTEAGLTELIEAGERLKENCPIDVLACRWIGALAKLEGDGK